MNMKEFSAFVWYVLFAVLAFGVYALIALPIVVGVLWLIHKYKPEWEKYME